MRRKQRLTEERRKLAEQEHLQERLRGIEEQIKNETRQQDTGGVAGSDRGSHSERSDRAQDSGEEEERDSESEYEDPDLMDIGVDVLVEDEEPDMYDIAWSQKMDGNKARDKGKHRGKQKCDRQGDTGARLSFHAQKHFTLQAHKSSVGQVTKKKELVTVTSYYYQKVTEFVTELLHCKSH